VFFCCALAGLSQSSCKKLVEVNDPTTSTSSDIVYSDDGTAISAVTGIYAKLSNTSYPVASLTTVSVFCGLEADELTLYNATSQGTSVYFPYYTNSLSSINTGTSDFWKTVFPLVYYSNAAIDGLSKSTLLSAPVKKQLLGEALFLRAYFYFYLTNIYGDVPLLTSTDYNSNRLLARTNQNDVYKQVVADLIQAQSLLGSDFVGGDVQTVTSERTSPTKWAATALLARTYLFMSDYVDAEKEASSLIGNSQMFSLAPLSSVFLKNNNEAIWQLQPTFNSPSTNTRDARLFVLPASGPNTGTYPVYLNGVLVNSFDSGDNRKLSWLRSVKVGSNLYWYPFKYQNAAPKAPVTEYLTMLRLGEQYLIRAEARAQQGNISGAVSDLDTIRSRAGLPATTASDKPSLLSAILHERQVELFTEFGHRWFDLKRTNNLDAVMGVGGICASKGGNWSSFRGLFPIPSSETQADVNLSQNAGYGN
jgi:hypothetical protein